MRDAIYMKLIRPVALGAQVFLVTGLVSYCIKTQNWSLLLMWLLNIGGIFGCIEAVSWFVKRCFPKRRSPRPPEKDTPRLNLVAFIGMVMVCFVFLTATIGLLFF